MCLPFQSVTQQRFTVIAGPIVVMLIPITLLIAILLPLSSMITCVCKKYRIQTHAHGEYDQTTLHRISDWSGIQQPSHTTWDPLRSIPLFAITMVATACHLKVRGLDDTLQEHSLQSHYTITADHPSITCGKAQVSDMWMDWSVVSGDKARRLYS